MGIGIEAPLRFLVEVHRGVVDMFPAGVAVLTEAVAAQSNARYQIALHAGSVSYLTRRPRLARRSAADSDRARLRSRIGSRRA